MISRMEIQNAENTNLTSSNDLAFLNTEIPSADTTHSSNTGDAHAADAHSGEMAPSEIIPHLLGELGDHSGLILGPYHVADLPVILYDNGLHFYANPQAMEAEGTYIMHAGHPVRAIDGGKPALDMSITNMVAFQWFAMLLIIFAMISVAGKYKKNAMKAPKGLQNVTEAMIQFVKNDIVNPNIPTEKARKYLLPYFLTLFIFIFVLNVIGLIPFGHSATGTIPIAAGLAITAFFVINFAAIRESGIGAWFKHLLGGAPVGLAPIMIPIEIAGLFIKPFALTVRLFANMTAGHIILLSLLGLLFMFKTIAIAPAISLFSVFIYLLEVLVAFLQAFIFTMLTAIFTGLAIGDHAHDDHHQAAH